MKNQNPSPNPIPSDLKALFSAARARRTKLFAYGFVFAFVACTGYLAFNPSSSASSPWFNNLFSSTSVSSFKSSIDPYRSQVSTLLAHFFPNSSSPADGANGTSKGAILGGGSVRSGDLRTNQTQVGVGSQQKGADSLKNGTKTEKSAVGMGKDGGLEAKNQNQNQTVSDVSSSGANGGGATEKKRGSNGAEIKKAPVLEGKNQTNSGTAVSKPNGTSSATAPSNGQKGGNFTSSMGKGSGATEKKRGSNGAEIKKAPILDGKNQTNNGTGVSKSNGTSSAAAPSNGQKGGNLTSSMGKGSGSSAASKAISNGNGKKREKWIEDMVGCDLFQGHWVKDESYPLYPEGSCPHIDEPFDCYLNGRPDRDYQKLRWQPDGCNIPRLNATDMLDRLRGKRLVFVGDSLNRNMWESLVCVLKNSVKDKKKVFEASGRHEFRTEGSYSFLFKDYGATVEFFRSPFLVQEWEMPTGNGTKETLRLDIIERSSSKYKDAHVIIFNTGHWWTHEKTAKGKDYYQEGSRVYSELNVVEAFHKALNTWAKWVDTNVNPKKSLVFFRGYSASHFSGGQWNSGGACDRETEPIKNEKYLSSYPPKMSVLESVIKGMKTPVSYLNITRMTDYRKDAHPSVYRKQNLTEEERKDPLRFQDCSHWCLPGVPDTWNELVYAQLIIKQYQMSQ